MSAEELFADLVLAGGGVKGISLVGAAAALIDAGYAPQRISGTSAGALVGAVLAAAAAAGPIQVEQLEQLALEVDYASFLDQSALEKVPLLGPAWGVLSGDGIYRGDALHAWVTRQLDAYGVRTFADLAIDDPSLPPEQRYRLVVTVADVSLGQLVRLPWDYGRIYGLDPDEQLVADAVRASTAIPFFYKPATLTRPDGGESTLVDGGLLANYPIYSFDRPDREPPRWPTFGVVLMPPLPDRNEEVFPALKLLHKVRPPTLLEKVVTTMLVGHDQTKLAMPWVAARTIRVDTSDVGVLEFDLTEQQKAALYHSGYAAGREFLSGWDFDDYRRRYR
ncbi:patatin-like phospholipase family protein [Mycolicibacterium brumae]|uniref:Phospholipase n=1 Tax=Mycolicibacterium brumae TaxID=85968 RepID=A0A2G5P655_9MYCO|nr:patatin-like phospholipase family protein [Mycolicibacterium brumae]MCV7193007.1 patatin-like phospholipase family protein [Mycolicibacterium brumae]PIB73851.1 phospholipase [Mycolicibacterium brumae]RWA23597.1 hypothetical protein MBRU_01855 [Mycolicibacterium brumae DSM 44177]UWW08474.1 patatin-like phospholipase family protein [Mycolicibacterium brumae]